jgi:hypothetical protein
MRAPLNGFDLPLEAAGVGLRRAKNGTPLRRDHYMATKAKPPRGEREAIIALAAGLREAFADPPLTNGVKLWEGMRPKSSEEAEWRSKLDALWQSGKPAWRKRFAGFEQLRLLRELEAKNDV